MTNNDTGVPRKEHISATFFDLLGCGKAGLWLIFKK